MTTAASLKALRTETGLTQSEIATVLDCTQGYISQVELGMQEPTIPWLIMAAIQFGKPYSALLSPEQVKDLSARRNRFSR